MESGRWAFCYQGKIPGKNINVIETYNISVKTIFMLFFAFGHNVL